MFFLCHPAIGSAFEHGILHRDISIGNVMAVFNNDGKDFVEGILNDWDHFGYTKSSNEARSVRRSVSLMTPISDKDALR